MVFCITGNHLTKGADYGVLYIPGNHLTKGADYNVLYIPGNHLTKGADYGVLYTWKSSNQRGLIMVFCIYLEII